MAHFLKYILLFCTILVFFSVLGIHCLATCTTLLLHHHSPTLAAGSVGTLGLAVAPHCWGTTQTACKLAWDVSNGKIKWNKQWNTEIQWKKESNSPQGPPATLKKLQMGEPMAALLHWENVKVRHLPSETSKTNNNRKYSTACAEAWQKPLP